VASPASFLAYFKMPVYTATFPPGKQKALGVFVLE